MLLLFCSIKLNKIRLYMFDAREILNVHYIVLTFTLVTNVTKGYVVPNLRTVFH